MKTHPSGSTPVARRIKLFPAREFPDALDLAPAKIPDRSLLTRYSELRLALITVNNSFSKRLPLSALWSCAKSLGCPDKAWLRECIPPEFYALVDFAVHRHLWRKKNSVARLLAMKSAPRADSDHGRVLQALGCTEFSLFTIEEVHAGLGVVLFDVLRGRRVFVMDELLSHNARRDMAVSARLIEVEGIWMCTGGILQLDPEVLFLVMHSADPEYKQEGDVFTCPEMTPVDELAFEGFALSLQFLANAGGLDDLTLMELLDRIDRTAEVASLGENPPKAWDALF